jgi:hypothetical protein
MLDTKPMWKYMFYATNINKNHSINHTFYNKILNISQYSDNYVFMDVHPFTKTKKTHEAEEIGNI